MAAYIINCEHFKIIGWTDRMNYTGALRFQMAPQCDLLFISYELRNKNLSTQCEILSQTPKCVLFYYMVVIVKPSTKHHLENSMQVNSGVNCPTITMPFPHYAELNDLVCVPMRIYLLIHSNVLQVQFEELQDPKERVQIYLLLAV